VESQALRARRDDVDLARELPYGPAACDNRRNDKAGHMSAPDHAQLVPKIPLAAKGASTHVPKIPLAAKGASTHETPHGTVLT
jgi:hypothetical protein